MRHNIIPLFIGLLCGALTFYFRSSPYFFPGPGDLRQALLPAYDLLSGRAPLSWPVDAMYIPSPLTIIPIGLPFYFIPGAFAPALFIALSCGWLAWSILRDGPAWRLLLFVSPAMLVSIIYSQYTPLLLALALSSLAPIGLLIKPHIAIPLLIYRARRAAWIVAFVVCGVSLLVYPLWPIKWLAELRPYTGIIPLLLPGGFVLLLAGLRWREQGARLMLLSVLMPMRGVYDQINLLMIPPSLRTLLIVLIVNWLAFIVFPVDESAQMLIGFYMALATILMPPLKYRIDAIQVRDYRRHFYRG